MLYYRVLNHSIPPIASASLAGRSSSAFDACDQSSTRATQRKPRPLYFQSLTHSSQFTNRHISRIFLALRALRQDTLGVGSLATPQNSAAPLTPIKSVFFDKAPCKPFRILLFQNTPNQLL